MFLTSSSLKLSALDSSLLSERDEDEDLEVCE